MFIMEKRNKKSNRNPRRKSKPASRQEVVTLERLAGMKRTRQSLLNKGRSSSVIFLKAPQGPRPGAALTVRELASTFNTQSGLSNVGGTTPAQFIVNSPTGTFAAVAFRLDDLPNLSAYTALFDQYRVERVKIHFRTRNPATFVANTGSPNGSVPQGYLVVDRDDSTAPASASVMQQYDNAIAFCGTDSMEVDLVPSVTATVFASGAFSGYNIRDSDGMWLDCANSDVPCYGVKVGASALSASTTSNWTWDIVAEYIVSFRKTR